MQKKEKQNTIKNKTKKYRKAETLTMKTNAGPKKCQTNEKKSKIKFSKYLLVSATLNFEILQNKCTQNKKIKLK